MCGKCSLRQEPHWAERTEHHGRVQSTSSSVALGPATVLWAWLAWAIPKCQRRVGWHFILLGQWFEAAGREKLFLHIFAFDPMFERGWGGGDLGNLIELLRYFDRNFEEEGTLRMKPRVSHMATKGSTTLTPYHSFPGRTSMLCF